MLRKTIFWMHLSCGVVAGLVILMMSVTGVLLTYERQITEWADFHAFAPPDPAGERLPLQSLIESARDSNPDFAPTSIQVFQDKSKPVVLSAGRSGQLIVDPYTGKVLGPGSRAVHNFFGLVTGWHRWFNLSGESRNTARAITGASNFLFFFMVLSGIYLWFPALWNRAALRTRLLFRRGPTTGKARDFNWHHVIGIWSAVPLVIIVGSSVVFSYGWANNLVYRIAGEEPPVRGRPGNEAVSMANAPAIDGQALSLDQLANRAEQQTNDWKSLSISLAPGPIASISLDRGNGGQPQLRSNLELDRRSGKVVSWTPFSSQSAGRQARTLIRFLHTGEALGLVGQTIAGLVTLGTILMVWTGLALAYRRLVVPLFISK